MWCASALPLGMATTALLRVLRRPSSVAALRLGQAPDNPRLQQICHLGDSASPIYWLYAIPYCMPYMDC
ncbi:hypothetical protein BRADI_1g27115v3 [Brachypodium distachyon]|uniref:Uncharacterized protein n=1 Tax=Brachypodium distachyon TaxID=15368 RepID=A0A0Q3H0F4_BRADI|nr:hypothetical protein BRADI_1g27115v3 [Brachypodium distachyon]